MDFTFLLCSERSGSNLITKIMDSHSMYCGPTPVHLFRIILNNRIRYGDLTDSNNRDHLLKDIILILNTGIGVWKTHWIFKDLQRVVGGNSLSDIFRVIYEKEAEANGKNRLFIKENHIYNFLAFLQNGFSNVKYLFFVRDPRDMALSWKLSPNLRGCVIRAAKTWKEDQSNCLRLYSSTYEQGHIFLLRYEDLLMTPERQLKNLCNFLDIEFEANMLNFSKNELTARNSNSTADWKNLKKPLMVQNFKKYNSGLSKAEIQYIECLCKEEMELLGYYREFDYYPDLEELERKIKPVELYEKPEYQQLPLIERQLRKKRYRIVMKIQSTPVVPYFD